MDKADKEVTRGDLTVAAEVLEGVASLSIVEMPPSLVQEVAGLSRDDLRTIAARLRHASEANFRKE